SQLKRIDIDGGTIRSLARASFGMGGAWSSDGTIVFTPVFSGPIYRIPPRGEPTVLTRLAPGEVLHRPMQFLPDGRHFLYAAAGLSAEGVADTRGIYVGDLDGAQSRRVADGDLAVLHLPSNRLLFIRQGTLFSQPV